MDLSEINWDINEAGDWPVPIKIIAGVLVFFLIIGGGYYQFIGDKLNELNREETELTTAVNSYGTEWRMALNLELHQQQYKEIEASLADMMRLMPTQAEMASLLVDISQTGISSGLEFTLFKPAGKITRDDVVALPINIKVRGRYKELGLFVGGLAALPRIVTIKDIQISPLKGANSLKMEATVTTYQEIEAGEEQKPGLMDNSYLVCLKEDGLIIDGCTKTSNVNLSEFPELIDRLSKKREDSSPVRVGEIKRMDPLEIFIFNPDEIRDPFSSKSADKPGEGGLDENQSGISPDFNRKKGVLEKVSLDTLVLIGYIKKEHDPINWGLIKVASGKIHRVKKGNYLGKNYGKIIDISSAKIDIMEIIPNGQGGWEERAASIALSKADEK
jgi:type IV pilus assembly protein PilO